MIKKIVREFKRIQNLGYIKSRRSHNTGIGKTFEDYLGVEENNLKDPDFEGFEVKAQRFLANSKITLFTKSPSNPPKANIHIRENFGEPYEDNPNLKKIHTSFYHDKYNSYLNRYGFKLKIDHKSERLSIYVKDLNKNKIIDKSIYYEFDDLKKSVKKLDKLFVVTADTKLVNEIEYFHFTEAQVFIRFNFEKFINFIAHNKIQYDIRIGSYKSGKNYGKPHDHGSGFRINREDLHEIYDAYKVIK